MSLSAIGLFANCGAGDVGFARAGFQFTLPKDFAWGEALEGSQSGLVREMIGEAVPPLFTEAHGRVLADLLEGKQPPEILPGSDRRVSDAARKLEVS